MTLDRAILDRQTQIWTNLYGPVRAADLVARSTSLAAARPELEPRAVFAIVDPDDVDAYSHFVATRW
jgi:hypothetical protein